MSVKIPILEATIIDIIKSRKNPDRDNYYGCLLALYNTREQLPIRCGRVKGDYLCKRCFEDIFLDKKYLLGDSRSVKKMFGFIGRYFDHYILKDKSGYHFKGEN